MPRPRCLRRRPQRRRRIVSSDRFGDLREGRGRTFKSAQLKLGRSPCGFTRTRARSSRDCGFGDIHLICPGLSRRREARFERRQIRCRTIGRLHGGRTRRRSGDAGTRRGRRGAGRFGGGPTGRIRRSGHARQRRPSAAALRAGAKQQGNGQKSRESKVSHRGGTIEMTPLSRKRTQSASTVQTQA